MSAHASPDIVTDGLVLCLDAADKKSLLAPPTTNLANNSNGTIDWATSNLVGTRTQSTVDANAYHYRFVLDKGTNSNIQFRLAIDHTNLTDGETYIISFKYKIISGSGTFKVTDFCDSSVTRVTTDIGDGWYYETGYASRSSYNETYDFFDFSATDNMTVDVKEVQVEHTSASSPLATPFVSYQRKWKNRTGINDGTFFNMNDQSNFSSNNRGELSFDGTNEYFSLGSNVTVSPVGFTVMMAIDVNDSQSSSSWNYWFVQTANDGHKYEFGKYGAGGNSFSFKDNFNTSQSSKSVSLSPGFSILHFGTTSSSYSFSSINGEAKALSNGSSGWTGGNDINFDEFFRGGSSYFGAKIANMLIYNKELSQKEILQNFKATKSKFNL